MKIIKGIKTNLGSNYSFCSGNNQKTMRMELLNFRESDVEAFERLSKKGYTRITFKLTTTAVRGFYSMIAYCK